MPVDRPHTLMDGLRNRKTHSIKIKHEVNALKFLRDEVDKFSIDKQELEVKLELVLKEKKELQVNLELVLREKKELQSNLDEVQKENKRLVDKVVESIEEIQQLEETLRRKNDILKFKQPRGKLSNFISGMQDKLKNRPSLDSVKKTKIWQNEPCFDTDLDKVKMHETYQPSVPKVLVECIQKLESTRANMEQLGLYRTSGSHAFIQKIRFKVDANNYRFLQEQTDASNLTGIIKLFFRELQSPLLPLKYIEQVIVDENAFINKSLHDQIADVKKIFQLLPEINQSTLQYFLEHIKRVADEPKNEMTAKSLSMVCGACVCFETMQNYRDENSVLVPNKCIEIMIMFGTSVYRRFQGI